MSGRDLRAGWKPWAGREPLEPAAPRSQIAQPHRIVTQNTLPAAVKLDEHLTSAIAEFSPKENAMTTETDQAVATVPAAQPAGPAAPSASTATPATHGLNVKQMMEDHMRMMAQISAGAA